MHARGEVVWKMCNECITPGTRVIRSTPRLLRSAAQRTRLHTIQEVLLQLGHVSVKKAKHSVVQCLFDAPEAVFYRDGSALNQRKGST